MRRVLPIPIATGLGLLLGAGLLGSGIAHATTTSAPCLWDGSPHTQGSAITSGGWNFRCTDDQGTPTWQPAGRTAARSTVPVPGADTNPTGLFSVGARQPGTSYDDYCVGDQLIPGTDDVYEAYSGGDGHLYWRAVAPISRWSFDPGAAHPAPTTRTASLCHDGDLT
ncbi:hypothetical protein K7711_03240 [Nocardia sp. CA2R105]|uniref:hypothetical protein n=1 Tax=Nocardia coffeae TaxID=2873381 RepID=UPI001CA6F97C|nr:hypothetical protein [Nocardia coffeae]MBY8855483.1 hypothetical protein [Nocardia coffeae]